MSSGTIVSQTNRHAHHHKDGKDNPFWNIFTIPKFVLYWLCQAGEKRKEQQPVSQECEINRVWVMASAFLNNNYNNIKQDILHLKTYQNEKTTKVPNLNLMRAV